jgi:CelD/BcsL family acetyltransferase involved in cellulose biosynthesis
MGQALTAGFDGHRETMARPLAAKSAALVGPALPPIDIEIYEDLGTLEALWRTFEGEADGTVFQTFDWLATWQRSAGHHTDSRPAIVVGRKDADILFLLPLATRSAGFVRELTWLGTDLCDYNAPLLAPAFSATVTTAQIAPLWQKILCALRKHARLHFDLIRLEKMPQTVGAQSNPMLALGTRLNPSNAYATPLMDSWDRFYAARRSAATRSRERSKRKKLAEFGTLALITPASADDMLTSFGILAAQKARAFQQMGAVNIFARPGFCAFYAALIASPQARRMLHITRLDCGGQAAAVNLGLVFRGTYYHVLASHTDGELARFGPGAAHMHDILRYAIERGLTTFDFTIGDEPYKRNWCDTVQPLYDHMAAASARGACVLVPSLLTHWLRRRVKQTPVLWAAFKRTRAAVASLLRR